MMVHHLGTPITMTDQGGLLVWRAEHLPFGGIYAMEDYTELDALLNREDGSNSLTVVP